MKKAIVVLLMIFCVWGCGSIEVKGPGALAYDEHMRLGTIYESKGEFDLALREYESARRLDPGAPGSHFASGNVYLKQKEYAKAEASYLKAIELDPAADFYNNLSWVYVGQGRIDEAKKAVRQAVAKAAPEKAYVYLDTLGVVLMNAGEYLDAEDSLLKAASEVTGQKREAYLTIFGHLIELYRKSGKEEQAAVVEEKLELYKSATEGGAKGGL